MKKTKITVSVRMLEEEKRLIEQIGEGSVSRGISQLLDHYRKGGLNENDSSFVQLLELKKLDEEIQNLNSDLFVSDDHGKREIALLKTQLEAKKREFFGAKSQEIKNRLKSLVS